MVEPSQRWIRSCLARMVLGLAGLLGAGVSGTVWAANTWSIHDYEIVYELPKSGMNQVYSFIFEDAESELEAISNMRDQEDLPAALEEEIERWMRQVAYYLDSQGFPEPRHEQKNADGTAFLVYAHPFGRTARAMDDCHEPSIETYIAIDPAVIVDNGAIPTMSYQDLAHEIFHTIQYAYPMFKKCDRGSWITEGTAEAVGIEVARTEGGKKPYTPCQIGPRAYGGRLFVQDNANFESNLRDPPCNMRRTYYTLSFWQFLGEWATGMGKGAPGESDADRKRRWGVGRPKPEAFVPPNYRYLQTLFSTAYGGHSQKNDMDWLDAGLQEHFGFDLPNAYATFAGTWSGYDHEKRLANYISHPFTNKLANNWKTYAFGGCIKVPVARSTTPIILPPQDINAVAARCYQFDFAFSGQATFHLVAEGKRQDIKDLMFTTGGGANSIPPTFPESSQDPAEPENGEDQAKAQFHFSMNVAQGTPEIVIMTNAAADRMTTRRHRPKLSLVFQAATSSKVTPKKPGQRPQQAGQPALTPEEEAQQTGVPGPTDWEIESGLEAQEWRVAVSHQQRDREPCAKAFVDRLCGRRTRISIDLVPAAMQSLQGVLTPMGSMERMSDVLQSVRDRGDMNFVQELQSAMQEIAQIEGSSIALHIPYTSFGDTGSHSNALITVNKADNGDGQTRGDYRSVGPGPVGDCQSGAYYPFSGTVVIEEASETVLRGSYSGQLVDPSAATSDGCIPPSLPIHDTISGSFSIPNPDIGQEYRQAPPAVETVDHLINETSKMLPGLITPEMAAEIRARAAAADAEDAAEEASSSANADAATIALPCPCDCIRSMETVVNRPDCYPTCKTQWEQCPQIDAINQVYEINRPPTTNEATEMARMRNELVALLTEKEPSERERTVHLRAFDQAPGFDAKSGYYKIVKQFYQR